MVRPAVPHIQCLGEPLTTLVLIFVQLQVLLLVSGCVLDTLCCSQVPCFSLREDITHMPCRSFPPEFLQPRALFQFVFQTKVLLHASPSPQALAVTTSILNLVTHKASGTCSLCLCMNMEGEQTD